MQQRPNIVINDEQSLDLHNISVLLIHNDFRVYERFQEYSESFNNSLVYAESIEYLRSNKLILVWDVIYIDVNMYRDECIEIINIFKISFPHVKIIFLGDELKLHERIEYIKLGADLILSNHLIKEEFGLITRYLYTNAKMNAQPETHADNSVLFDIITSELHLNGTDTHIELNHQEASLIKLFILDANQQLETWQLLDSIGSLDSPRGRKNLEVFISRLRKKLAPLSPTTNPIKAIRKYGYELNLRIKIKNYSYN